MEFMSARHAKQKKPGSTITQKELARRLKISQMTISRVLNNRPGVGAKLKQEILEQMARHGYVHDQVAAGLRSKTTRTVGLIVPDITDSFFPEITRNIEMEARGEAYRIILTQSYESYEQEVQAVTILRGLRVAGMIIAPSGTQADVRNYRLLEKLEIPFVFIDRVKEKVGCSSVVTDVEKGAWELGRYLIGRGYRRWGYIGGPEGISSSEEHLRGICRSLTEAGRNPDEMVCVRTGFSESDGQRGVGTILKQGRPDVIVCINDPVAMGAYAHLKELKFRVPEDVALAGFSDLKWSGLLEVPLTTVREPTAEIGRWAMRILLDEIRDPDSPRQRMKLEPELVIRQSA
jgi:DNA-binding LacI/PurR family transcriptional regulator